MTDQGVKTAMARSNRAIAALSMARAFADPVEIEFVDPTFAGDTRAAIALASLLKPFKCVQFALLLRHGGAPVEVRRVFLECAWVHHAPAMVKMLRPRSKLVDLFRSAAFELPPSVAGSIQV
ncbi:MAG: hypothetical protein KIT73_10235, partial [Burkholderiales bacterium]|nr:hypothetical protein [Burkholderiales bacterium]